MNRYSEFILSLLLIIFGLFFIYIFRKDVLFLIKGFLGPFILLIGFILLLVSIEDFKN